MYRHDLKMKMYVCMVVCLLLMSIPPNLTLADHTHERSQSRTSLTHTPQAAAGKWEDKDLNIQQQQQDEQCTSESNEDFCSVRHTYDEHGLWMADTDHFEDDSVHHWKDADNTDFTYEENSYLERVSRGQEAEQQQAAVWTLISRQSLDSLVAKKAVAVIYFYGKDEGDDVYRFLAEYSEAAADLVQYNVHLATVDCSVLHAAPYCNPEKVDHFAYGFREGVEKIAFPLDTLYNANAIVASALHLALINTVPILQTATERRDLEARCKGRCNIIFAFLRTLGTLEHRTFLESAFTHQEDFVFAITTYTAGTLDLPATPATDEHESRVWMIHCLDKDMTEDCIVSQYRDQLLTSHLGAFINALKLPLWHDLKRVHSGMDLLTPYDGSDLPWVLLMYDGSCESRVKDLAPHLSQLLHGSVATITVNLDDVSEAAMRQLGLTTIHSITTPAVAYLRPAQNDEVLLLNDFDDPLAWVKEQLEAEEERQRHEEQALEDQRDDLPHQALELQHDDETILGMVGMDTFVGIPSLAGPDPYQAAISSDSLTLIAYYLSWDPVSNALLQHLSLVTSALHNKHPSRATVYRVDCFDWPQVCDSAGVNTYPLVRIHPPSSPNVTYSGPIHRDYIIRSMLLLEVQSPLELVSSRELESLMRLDWELHPACPYVTAAAIGIFIETEDGAAFRRASRDLRNNYLLGLHISATAVYNLCESNSGCIVVTKPQDTFQPRTVLNKGVDDVETITHFIHHATLPVMAQLDPERFNILMGSETVENSKSSVKHLAILFLPSTTNRPPSPYSKDNGVPTSSSNSVESLVTEDDWGTKLGRIASEMSEPELAFTWLLCDDPLAEELLTVYDLTHTERSLVALSFGDHSTTIHIFPSTNTTLPAFRDWFSKLRTGRLTHQIELPEGEQGPVLEGFDFLKFMREDQDHDAEDHLIMEMEADLTSQQQHQDNGDISKKYSQEL